ncbi:MAG: helix-turn-helix domain-containing protein [Treponema sp.]|nr:helix-turn-helix domain-containing protein [Treponema sp.]
MSKLNIIQRRELKPLMLKADRIAKHYEKAANCAVAVVEPDLTYDFGALCNCCKNKDCNNTHIEAVNKARQLGGSYIYLCGEGTVFWTSPFYSGERFAGALISGGIKELEKNSEKVKALARMILLCADRISSMSFNQKNTVKLSMNKERRNSDYKHSAIEDYAEWRNIADPEDENQEKNFLPKWRTDQKSSLEMERMLLASLRRGDKTEAQKIMVMLLRIHYLEVRDSFPAFRLKAMELAVLLSRAAADPKDIKDNTSLENTYRCLTKIDESRNFNEISETLKVITEHMSGKIFSFHGVRHFSALRKAERYIWENYSRKLSLKEIAAASGLSAPYFSTVFKEEMGENLSNYLNRLRVEKAAALLVTSDLSISDIAVTCGFEDQSWFSKIFKNNTGLTPGKYRERGIDADGIHAGA